MGSAQENNFVRDTGLETIETATFTPNNSHIGKHIHLTVTYTDTSGEEQKKSVLSEKIINDPPRISGIDIIYNDTSSSDVFDPHKGVFAVADTDHTSHTFTLSGAILTASKSGYTHSITNGYGKFFINENNGNYLFEPDNTAINLLSSFKTETSTVTVSDGLATSDAGTIKFVFNGVEDGPSVSTGGSQTLAVKTDDQDPDDRDTGFRIILSDVDTVVTETSHTMTITGSHGDKFILKPLDVSSGKFGLYLKAGASFSDSEAGIAQISVKAAHGEMQSNIVPVSVFVDAVPTVLITGSSTLSPITSGRALTASLNTGYTLHTEDDDGTSGATTVVFRDANGKDVSSLFRVSHSDGTIALNTGSILTESLVVKAEFTDDEGNTVISTTAMNIPVTPSPSISIDGVISTNMRVRPDISEISDQHESFPDFYYTWEKGTLDASGNFIPEGFSSSSETLVLGTSAYGGKYLRLTVGYTDQDGENQSLSVVSENPVNYSPSLDDEVISYTEDSGEEDPTGRFDGSDRDAGSTLTYQVKDSVADTTETGYTHRWDATYGKLFYNEGSGAYIFKPDTFAIEPLNEATSQYAEFFASDGIATTTGELTVKIIGVNDAQAGASASQGGRVGFASHNEIFHFMAGESEAPNEADNTLTLDMM